MSSANTFFQTPELVLRLAWRVVFKTLVTISHINRVARRAAKRVFYNKLCRNVGKMVVPETHDSLSRRRKATLLILKKLRETGSWITGSVALASLIFAPNTTTPRMRGLDILVPFAALRRWKLIMELDLSFDKGKERAPRPEMRQAAVSVTRFCRDECTVNIITFRVSVIPAVVASRLTSQMNLFNGDVAVSIYPTLTTNKYGLLAWPAAAYGYTAWHQLDHSRTVPFRTHLVIANSNSHWIGQCGVLCPRIWRSLKGLRGIGFFFFGENVGTEVAWASDKVLWRIGKQCSNKDCDFRGSN